MSKLLSSRLQSRVAKRRSSICGWEQERAGLKTGLQIIHRLREAGLPGSVEAQLRGRSAMRHLKHNLKELAQDQQLDKALLRMTYEYENQNMSFILGGHMGNTIVLEGIDTEEDESTRL